MRVAPGLLEYLTESARLRAYHPTNITVLLPFEGKYASTSNSIRAGLLQSYYANDAEDRPVLHFVDTTALDDVAAYVHQAVENGTDFIIGPLRKRAVQALAAQGSSAPVLALNQITSSTEANFYQFGLDPEQEAVQAAEKAWIDGQRSMIAIVPQGSWGTRILDSFAQRWNELGGELLEAQQYPPLKNDFGEQIIKLLDLDQSQKRYKRLSRTLGEKPAFEPRRRQDVDAVFMAAHPRQARLIRPQFRFYHAQDLPVYATSHVYSGSPDPSKDSDLNSVLFCDMPVLLVDPKTTDGSDYNPRLFAFGQDAYNLIPHLNEIGATPDNLYSAYTGRLTLNPQGQIQRRMAWAQFKKGLPVLQGYAPIIPNATQTSDGVSIF